MERQIFDIQFKKWRPTQVVRERIATPFYLVQLQGPPPYFLILGISSWIIKFSEVNRFNIYHTHHALIRGLLFKPTGGLKCS